MPRVFSGPVEISEKPTAGLGKTFIGTSLRLTFQCTAVTADVNKAEFPTLRFQTARVQTFQEWQQHEVRVNGVLVGTIDKQQEDPAGGFLFEFPFQQRVLKVDTTPNPWECPLASVNVLEVALGSGGFGLEDSFDIDWIEAQGFTTTLDA